MVLNYVDSIKDILKNQNSIILHIFACTVMTQDKISIPPAEAIKLKLLKSIVID